MNKYETNYITKTCKKNNNKDTWIIKENTHVPIIEKEKYNKVQELKIGKSHIEKVSHKYLLQDLLYCGRCKRKLQYKIYRSADKQELLYNSAGFKCSLVYKKECKNKTYIREKDINNIVKNEVVKKLSLIEIDKTIKKIIDYYKENNKDMQTIREYKNEIERLERKKSVLYKKKCEKYITVQEFKIEYTRVKKEIERIDHLIKNMEDSNANKLEEEKIKKIVTEIKKGEFVNSDFLKEIVNRIEVYSKNKIEIIFNKDLYLT